MIDHEREDDSEPETCGLCRGNGEAMSGPADVGYCSACGGNGVARSYFVQDEPDHDDWEESQWPY